jgi:hypothetical protein
VIDFPLVGRTRIQETFMNAHLFAPVLLAAFAAPPAATAPNGPAFIAQAQPVSRLLADAREFVKVVAGPQQAARALKQFDDGLQNSLGEKGLEGLDLNRHLAAYATLAEQPEKSTVVLVLPITGEKEFIELLDRLPGNLKGIPVDGKKGLLRLDARVGPPPVPVFMRLVENNAYISINDPEGDLLDPAKLLAPESLLDLGDQAQLTIRAYPSRLPAKLIKLPFEKFDEFRKSLKNDTAALVGLGAMEILALSPFVLFLQQHVDAVLADGQEVALRYTLTPNADLGLELGVTAKPGTKLATSIASLPPGTNRFASLVPKDAAFGLTLTLPVGVPQLRDGALDVLAMAEKGIAEAPPPTRPVLAELIKGLARTAKAGDADIAGAFLAPNAKGEFHTVWAASFENPRGVEDALRALVKDLPEEAKKIVELDIETVNGVKLHRISLEKAGLEEWMKKVFTDKAALGLAFTPKAVYATIGPDPVHVMKTILEAKPGPAKLLDLTCNFQSFHKMTLAADGERGAKRIEALFTKDDRTISVMSLSAQGGAEFKLKFTFSPLFLPRAMAVESAEFPAP